MVAMVSRATSRLKWWVVQSILLLSIWKYSLNVAASASVSCDTGWLRAKRKRDDISCTSLTVSLKKSVDRMKPIPQKSRLNMQLSTTMPALMIMTSLGPTLWVTVSSKYCALPLRQSPAMIHCMRRVL